MARPELVERLHAITVGIVQPPKRPVMQRVDDGDVVISRELCKEILKALTHAGGFASFITRRVHDNTVGEYASSVRDDVEQAMRRLRQAAIAQDEGRSA